MDAAPFAGRQDYGPEDAEWLSGQIDGQGARQQVIRALVPDGGRLRGLMTLLADLRRQPILLLPAGAQLRPATDADDHIIPVVDEKPVPWDIVWPRESWAASRGLELVAAENPFPGFLALGLHVGSDGLMLFYNRSGGFPVQRHEGADLAALGWENRRDIVIITEGSSAEGIDDRLREISVSLNVTIFYGARQALVSLGRSSELDELQRREPEPGLLDLALITGDQGAIGFVFGHEIVPVDSWTIADDLLDQYSEARLLM
jgi:hypothetical protein